MRTPIYFLLLITFPIFCFGQEKIKDSTENKSIKSVGVEEYEFIYTNAVNFDFGNTAKSSLGYFGHINYFFNVKRKSNSTTHFINTGFIKANYYATEINNGSFYQVDNVIESPLSSTEPGNTYIREYNEYNYEVKLNSHSLK